MDIETVTLESLVGNHMLSGVDRLDKEIIGIFGHAEMSQVFNFVLDGRTYSAVENPDDGYRSMLREVYVSDEAVVNTFEPVEVLGVIRETELLDFFDVVNGKCVLSVGTNHYDDYYPSFVAEFSPQNMSTNDLQGHQA